MNIGYNRGEYKAIYFPNKEKFIKIADKWHEYFFWKVVSKDVAPAMPFPKAKSWWPYKTFYEEWAGAWFCSEDIPDTDKHYHIVVTYQRTIVSPYLSEMDTLKEQCEELVRSMDKIVDRINDAKKKMNKIISFGKAKNMSIIAQAEGELSLLNTQMSQKLSRVDEIRSLILSEQ